jgi:hypothetical protein
VCCCPSPKQEGKRRTSINGLASSFSRALHRFYPLAGRLAVADEATGGIVVSLCCNGEGAEFVHAAVRRVR